MLTPVFLENSFDDYFYFFYKEITLKKADGPLGLSIVGGSDHASHPFGVNEPGIFISKVIIIIMMIIRPLIFLTTISYEFRISRF